MAVSEEAVLEKLKNVVDPELFVNIVDLGLIYEVSVKPGVTVVAEAPPAPAEAVAPDGPAAAAVAEPGAGSSKMDVFIQMTMTSPACPAGPQLIGGAKREVASLDGVGQVEVKIVLDPPWTPDRMTEDARDQLGIF